MAKIRFFRLEIAFSRKLLQIVNLTTHSFIVKLTIWRKFLSISVVKFTIWRINWRNQFNYTIWRSTKKIIIIIYAYLQDVDTPRHWSSNHLPLRILGHQAPSRLCHLAGRAAESAARRQRASGYLGITTKKTVLRLFVSPLADERRTGRTRHLQTTIDSVVEILPTHCSHSLSRARSTTSTLSF